MCFSNLALPWRREQAPGGKRAAPTSPAPRPRGCTRRGGSKAPGVSPTSRGGGVGFGVVFGEGDDEGGAEPVDGAEQSPGGLWGLVPISWCPNSSYEHPHSPPCLACPSLWDFPWDVPFLAGILVEVVSAPCGASHRVPGEGHKGEGPAASVLLSQVAFKDAALRWLTGTSPPVPQFPCECLPAWHILELQSCREVSPVPKGAWHQDMGMARVGRAGGSPGPAPSPDPILPHAAMPEVAGWGRDAPAGLGT